MNKTVIVIGADRIGREFIVQTLTESGYEVIFLDAEEKIIRDINSIKQYETIVLGKEGNGHFIIDGKTGQRFRYDIYLTHDF